MGRGSGLRDEHPPATYLRQPDAADSRPQARQRPPHQLLPHPPALRLADTMHLLYTAQPTLHPPVYCPSPYPPKPRGPSWSAPFVLSNTPPYQRTRRAPARPLKSASARAALLFCRTTGALPAARAAAFNNRLPAPDHYALHGHSRAAAHHATIGPHPCPADAVSWQRPAATLQQAVPAPAAYAVPQLELGDAGNC